MAASRPPAPNASKTEPVMTRVFDVPPELVWKVWADPVRMMHGGDRKASRRRKEVDSDNRQKVGTP